MSQTQARVLFLLVAVLIGLLATPVSASNHVPGSIWVVNDGSIVCNLEPGPDFDFGCRINGGALAEGDQLMLKVWTDQTKTNLILDETYTAGPGGVMEIGGGGLTPGTWISVTHVGGSFEVMVPQHSAHLDAVNDVVSGVSDGGSVNINIWPRDAWMGGPTEFTCGRSPNTDVDGNWSTDFGLDEDIVQANCPKLHDLRPGDWVQIAHDAAPADSWDFQLAVQVPEFNDVVVTSTHAENISQMALENITLGCDANWNYCPNDPVTRAQMGSFLGRFLDVLGNGGVLGAVSGFDDVPDGNVHAARVRQIADAGITLGCNPAGTLYCPDDPVTRAQMATFIARALGLAPDPDNRFSDVVTGSTHAGNINAVAEAGVTLGCDPGGTMFCPNDSVTRAQMASFLIRALNIP